MDETTKQEGVTSRRAVIGGVGAIGVAVGLAACGRSEDGGDATNRTRTQESAPTDLETNDDGSGDDAIKTSDIPVGGGKIYAGQDTVVTQPKKGDYKAFSATCTHQGCIVANVANGTINCGCHGSKYSIEDGSVTHAAQGLTPQTQDPLPSKSVTVTRGTISVN